MSWRNIHLIFLREVRDQLRDRRTLFMVAILPLLLYPALGIGMMQMTLLFSEQPRTVVILGADDLPTDPSLLVGDKFNSIWFNTPTDRDKLEVITDALLSGDNELEEEERERREKLIAQARKIQETLAKRDAISEQLVHYSIQDDQQKIEELEQQEKELNDELAALFAESHIQVLLLVPEGFKTNVEKADELALQPKSFWEISLTVPHKWFSKINGNTPQAGDYPGVTAVRNRADEKSQIAYRRTKDALDLWEEEILRRRLRSAGLHENFAKPVNADSVDLAQESELSANLWSKLFPALLVIMAVTGAFYPAIDLGAGEKERGTMETLLICPATRPEIVMGKFFTIMVFSVSTALLNLVSMGFTGKYIASMGGAGSLSQIGSVSLPPFSSLIWILILLLPLAALFSALSLAFATFARSSKEGQYYLTPLLMVTMGLTVFCLAPGIEINPFYSIFPVVGPALLLKQLLAEPGQASALVYAVPVLVSSVAYSLLALWWAIDQFSRESILFREAERLDLGLWFKHLLRDKEARPSFAEAVLCFMLIMFLTFGAIKFMNEHLLHVKSTAPKDYPLVSLQALMIQQLVIIACPALFMGLLLTTDFFGTFRLRKPSWKMVALGASLPLVISPLTMTLQAYLQTWFFPPLPAGAAEVAASMRDESLSIWLLLLAFAVAPAICEELAYRGFILSGFKQSQRIGVAILLSSVMFGVMHMIPQQVFNASLLGLVLGLLAVKSRSLIPCIIFHFVNNAFAVCFERFGSNLEPVGPGTWFVSVGEQGTEYRWPLLLVCAAATAFLIRWLWLQPTEIGSAPTPEPSNSLESSTAIAGAQQ